MPRPMSSDMLAAIQAAQVLPAIFIQAQFLTGTVYIWSGYGNISWNGHTWSGVGTLLSISPIDEGSNIEARGISIGLSGLDNAMLADQTVFRLPWKGRAEASRARPPSF